MLCRFAIEVLSKEIFIKIRGVLLATIECYLSMRAMQCISKVDIEILRVRDLDFEAIFKN